jgi:hypothetical protein
MQIRTRVPLIVLLVLAPLDVSRALIRPDHARQGPSSLAEKGLVSASTANQEAQAKYYQELTKRLTMPPAAPTSSPPKSFSESVAENPGSVIGVVGTILAALFATLVGLTNLFIASRNAQMVQIDAQFYEAMRRFGEKDSPAARSSAAGLIAQMAIYQRHRFSLALRRLVSRISWPRPYFKTALDQLVAGLLLENNEVVLTSIAEGLQLLVPYDQSEISTRLRLASERVEEEWHHLLARFFVTNGCKVPPNPRDHSRALWDLWEEAAFLSGFENHEDLRTLVGKSRSFGPAFKEYLRAVVESPAQPPGVPRSDLRATSRRLRTIQNLVKGLQTMSPAVPSGAETNG